MTDINFDRLRDPFKPDRIGKLPKPYSKDAQKGNCPECGKYHGLPALHLDYVGHGALTERLLDVDPDWNWEPLAVDTDGLPKIVQRGDDLELWIRLTIGGRSKLGVGTCPKNQNDASKVLIGDALRNAGMRFGVALDLWIKGEGEHDEEPKPRGRTRERKAETPPPDPVAEHAKVAVAQFKSWTPTQVQDSFKKYSKELLQGKPTSVDEVNQVVAAMSADYYVEYPQEAPF